MFSKQMYKQFELFLLFVYNAAAMWTIKYMFYMKDINLIQKGKTNTPVDSCAHFDCTFVVTSIIN